MTNEKILNTRISLKIDSLANWEKSTLGLKKGELAIATVAASAGTGLTEPVVMIKVGEDGVKTFSQLPWNLYAKASDVVAACKSEASLTAFVNNVLNGEGGIVSRLDILEGNADTDGSVAKSIKDAIEALDLANTYVKLETGKSLMSDAEHTKLAGISDGATKVENVGDGKIKIDGTEVTVYEHPASHTVAEISDFDEKVKAYDYATKDEAKGYADAKDESIAAAKKAGDDAQAAADAKVASVSAGDASITVAGTATAPTVAAKLSADANNALTLVDDGLKVVIPAAAEYSIVKAADSGDYAAVYNLTKDGTIVGASINIPKDMVVKSGSVVDDEIVLVLNDEAATEIKIPVASLIEYVTSGSATGDMVVIHVDESTHKVTATITDGTVTLAKLATDVQTAIGKAHSHENKDVLDGITSQNIIDWNDAVTKEHEHSNKELIDTYDQTNADIKDAVDKKHTHSFNDNDVVDAIAKKHAHEFVDTDVVDAINKRHSHTFVEAELNKIADGDVEKWNSAVQSISTPAGADGEPNGLKAVKDGTDVAITLDDSIVWVFDCGDSGVNS